MSGNIVDFEPKGRPTAPKLRIIKPDDGKRFSSKKDRGMAKVGFRWVDAVKCYVAAPSDYDDERIAKIIKEQTNS